MKQFQTPKQSGFTLIELIVVMVILGILAATALPRFINMGGDARVASLNGARGAMNATVAMIHGRWLAGGGAAATVDVEGGLTVPVDARGFPTATQAFLTAAGIDTATDYTFVNVGNNGAGGLTPVTTGTQIAIIPRSVAGTTTGGTCFISYTASAAAVPPAGATNPIISAPPTPDQC